MQIPSLTSFRKWQRGIPKKRENLWDWFQVLVKELVCTKEKDDLTFSLGRGI